MNHCDMMIDRDLTDATSAEEILSIDEIGLDIPTNLC